MNTETSHKNKPPTANFYEGADGPTIMITVNSVGDLANIRQLFADLADSKTAVSLEELERIKITGFKTIQLKQIPEGRPSGLYTLNHTSEGIEFSWELSALEWLECAELMDGLGFNDKPGHQNFTVEGVDDVVVVVSYKE